MEKLNRFKVKRKYSSMLTTSFRNLAAGIIGELDTATSFMYLFRRFGAPTSDYSQDGNLLYNYVLKHEDLIISITASYHQFVYFNLHVPEKRYAECITYNKVFYQGLYRKYGHEVFMPYAVLPWGGTFGLTKSQHNKNWKLINKAHESFFSKEDQVYIENQLKSDTPDPSIFTLLSPFEQKLCNDFRAKLTESELAELNDFMPKIEMVKGLEQQCADIIRELKRGFYVRDVAINILGYESENNIINDFE
jgi:hypothetical protein